MATNFGPILLGLGAAFLLMRSKDSKSGSGGGTTNGSGFGTQPIDGSGPCNVLAGIWAPPMPGSSSPLAQLTDNPALTILPLTPEAYEEAEAYFIEWVAANTADAQADSVTPITTAAEHLTQGMDCDWRDPNNWTQRMKNVFNALEKMYAINRIAYIEEKYKL